MAAVELLYWDGCPSHPQALAELREALRELGLAGAEIATREIATDEQARAEAFVGSPTIRVDGADLFPPPPDEPPGLNCRVYRLADGRFSPTPDPAALRAALARAVSSPRPAS